MLNNVVLVGRTIKNPEIKDLGNDKKICNFTLAVNRNFKNADGEYEADFINCVAFNQVADLMEKFVLKGHLLAVQGRIQTRNYDGNDGKRVYVTEVFANNVSFLESKRSSEKNKNDEIILEDDDLPF